MRTLMEVKVEEVSNGVLLTTTIGGGPTAADPMGERKRSTGPTYHPNLEAAAAEVPALVKGYLDTIAVGEARKALNV